MIYFLKGKIDKIESIILSSFNNLPADKNEKSKGYFFRFRKFTRLHYENNEFKEINDTVFFQSRLKNRFAGGKKRKFKKVDNKVIKALIRIFKKNFIPFLPDRKKHEIGIHQLRIKCGNDFVGYPVPEGWHSDGFDNIVILNITAKNITGGATRIKINNLNSPNDLFSTFLKKGEFIFLNDKKFNHYTDPININANGSIGFRDMIVLTIKKT